MLNRQKVAIKLLQESGGRVSRLQLMKLLFLLGQESPSAGGSAFYRFMPYQYGPYSFSVQHEVDHLVRDGLVRERELSWDLTDIGRAFDTSLPVNIQRDVKSLIDKYGRFSVQRLRDSVYEHYPWFTLLTELKDRRAVQRPIAAPAIYTIGYEGMVIEGFVDHLLRSGIVRLIDVRSNPVSRRYGFHQGSLSRICRSVGIDYRHFPELGVPSIQRVGVHTREDIANLLDTYEVKILPRQTTALNEVAKLLRSDPGALVCMEAESEFCHRSRLANELQSRIEYPVIHLKGQR